jgi:hypothetical protein
VTSLLMPRSILTEKLSRRGYHLTREYGVDPLELVIVRELMSPLSVTASGPGANAKLPEFYAYADGTSRSAAEIMATEGLETLMVIDRATRKVCGTISLSDLLRGRVRTVERENERLRLFDHVPAESGGHN